jgi:aminoglycoside phosphotransferase (APT) family kinase protein
MDRALAAAAVEDLLPIVWQHADFGPWNVYVAGDRIGVIDWEAARHGPAVADLLYFLMHWTSASARLDTDDARVRHVESLFCTGGLAPIGGALHPHLAEYMRNLDIAPSLLPFLLLYTFLEQAIDRAQRCITVEPGRAVTRDGNLYVDCVGAMGRHAEALFATEVARAA